MRITINGETRDISSNTGVAELVDELGDGTRRIAVELNGDILPRSRHAGTELEEGDVIEIVQAIGGG